MEIRVRIPALLRLARTLFAAALAVACADTEAPAPEVSAPAPRPNVLLVTFDTTRYDSLGFTGHPEAGYQETYQGYNFVEGTGSYTRNTITNFEASIYVRTYT